ncbi:hypothetical protein M595_5406 [Lyngbya aestuarii BL J]|uniref:Uncharacterized protein n=1 Tax=Lyngbya aestuarii BL J TaxID=1348334 RepID=U7Q9Z3_9CYAN|nr:hypothetical protein M595_5406 [Lyngbya aestuarii BL J]
MSSDLGNTDGLRLYFQLNPTIFGFDKFTTLPINSMATL